MSEATADETGHAHLGVTFWIGLVIGGAVMVYGVRGVLTELGPDNPLKLATWVVGLDLAHDLVLAPAVVIVGLALARLLPVRMRGPIRTAAALSGLVVLFSVPLITAWGRRAGNSSTLPLNYAHSVIIVVTFVWLAAAGVILVRVLRARASSSPETPPRPAGPAAS